MRIKNRKPVIPENILWRIEENQTVIFDEQIGEPYLLNGTGTEIWKYCSSNTPIHQIIHQMQQDFDAQPADIERAVIHILADLRKKGVIQFVHDPKIAGRGVLVHHKSL